ncbi:cytochrome c3 family protein [Paracoccus sp. S1E-3]|uniref:cytochrome c3 family protein n=1 Tax=Paracoccus sp. S1E-3 TaxID=2756130 RepID=UPI0015EF4F65|nr:cytochrome c3 family protein [Paracoccus sp. S1E-3]MBA4489840.1 cytochrome c3 family protein [Paracoccus sp. S1E-3]
MRGSGRGNGATAWAGQSAILVAFAGLFVGALFLGAGVSAQDRPPPAAAGQADAAGEETLADMQYPDDIDPAWFNKLFQQVALNPSVAAAPEQPLPFNHEWHVTEVGLDCTNCHTNPDPGRLMTFPDTQTCMDCHSDIATDKEPIQRLTQYHDNQQSVPWVRVYQLLPGVNWSHRTHVDAGVGCLNCHGPVPELEQMREVTAVTAMASCQSCHQQQDAQNGTALNTCATCHTWPDDKWIEVGQ